MFLSIFGHCSLVMIIFYTLCNIYFSLQPFVQDMLNHHHQFFHALENAYFMGTVRHVDLFLTTMSFVANLDICLFTPDYIWCTNPINCLEDLHSFGMFVCLDRGLFINFVPTSVSPNLQDDDLSDEFDEEDDYDTWKYMPGTTECELKF